MQILIYHLSRAKYTTNANDIQPAFIDVDSRGSGKKCTGICRQAIYTIHLSLYDMLDNI